MCAVGQFDERLGRNTADVEADPAETVVSVDVDQCHATPSVRGLERGGVAAWAAADHEQIYRFWHLTDNHGAPSKIRVAIGPWFEQQQWLLDDRGKVVDESS